VNDLAGNETFKYISRLEAEQERLRNELKDLSSQLHASKVANASLLRRCEKISTINPI
jgi:hypothetical protein